MWLRTRSSEPELGTQTSQLRTQNLLLPRPEEMMGNISQKNWRAALREQRTFAQAIFDYSSPVFRFVQIVNISLISEHKMIIFRLIVRHSYILGAQGA